MQKILINLNGVKNFRLEQINHIIQKYSLIIQIN
jgi:hypothetical protein